MEGELAALFGSLTFVCCTLRIFNDRSAICRIRNSLSTSSHVLLALSSQTLARVLELALESSSVNCTIVTGHEAFAHAVAIVHEHELLEKGHFSSRFALRELEMHVRAIAPGESFSLRSGATSVKVSGESTTQSDFSALDGIIVRGAGRILRYTRPCAAHPRVEHHGVVSAACGRRMFSMLDIMVRSRGAVTLVSPIAREMLVLADMHRGYRRDFEVLGAPRSQYALYAHLSSGRLRLVTDLSEFANALSAPRAASATFASPAVLAMLSELGCSITSVPLGESDGEHVNVLDCPDQFVFLHMKSKDAGVFPACGNRLLLPSDAVIDLHLNAIRPSSIECALERHIHSNLLLQKELVFPLQKLSIDQVIDRLCRAGLHPEIRKCDNGSTVCDLKAHGANVHVSNDVLHVHATDSGVAAAICSIFIDQSS